MGRSRRQSQWNHVAPQQAAQEVQGVSSLLPAGPPYRHQHPLNAGAHPGAIAAPDLAQDYPEAKRQLGTLVGGVQTGEGQEGEHVLDMVPQMLGETMIGLFPLRREDCLGQRVGQPAPRDRQTVVTDLPGRM